MATNSSNLAWRIPMDRRAWCPWCHKQSDMTDPLSAAHMVIQLCKYTKGNRTVWFEGVNPVMCKLHNRQFQ